MTPAAQSRLTKGIVYLLLGAYFIWLSVTGILSHSKKTREDAELAPATALTAEAAKTDETKISETTWPVPSASASDEELLRLARQYVAISLEQAIAWAQSAADSTLRERLLFVTLRAWGELRPRDAARWALMQEAQWRFKRMEAVLRGAVVQPEVALGIGRALLAQGPSTGNAYGTALVADFIAVHEFRRAVQLASEASPEVQQQWLQMTYQRWANEQPREAIESLNSVASAESQSALFQSIAAGWANNDPAGLAAYAATLPASESRSNAMNVALEQWLNRDPVAMGEWLNTLPQNAETDAAAAKLIMRTDLANRSTEVALGWVAQIQDVNLKTSALEYVLKEWAQNDLEGTRKYLAAQTWIPPAKLQIIMEEISKPRSLDGVATAAD